MQTRRLLTPSTLAIVIELIAAELKANQYGVAGGPFARFERETLFDLLDDAGASLISLKFERTDEHFLYQNIL